MKLAMPLLATLEVGLNRYLSQDPSALIECERLLGRTLALRLRELDLCIDVTAVRGGLLLSQERGERAQASVETSVPAMLRLLAAGPEQRQALIASGEVAIKGDAGLVDGLFRILQRVDFDPEELASRVVGDVLAHRLGVSARSLFGWGRHTADTLGLDTAEYLREETHDLVHRADVEEWMDAVDTLSADSERLAARVRRLERRLAGA